MVADRAMFNEKNLSQMENLGIQYIVAARLKSLPGNLKNDILNKEYGAAVIEKELHWISEFEHNLRRLIVGYSPRRAKKDALDRQRLLDRLMKKVKGDKIQIKDLIPNYGSKKYIKVENNSASIHEEKIEADAQWDGFHGIITNVKDKTPDELLSKYRQLWKIEEAFRVNKHDLKMRPIFHWTEKRIKAHIVICFLAFALVKHAVYRVGLQHEPMSFERIRNELLHAQSSIMVDLVSRKKYVIPSHVTVNQKKIYQVFGLKRSQMPYELT